jgi:hypothetical protein
MAFRRTSARLVAIATLSVLFVLATASFAFAAPVGDQTLGLTALQGKLDASPSGSVSGYFKTVVRGSQIVTIPVEVLGLTGDTSASSLILFEASGTLMQKFGGIVAGMSGSPVYITDDGIDKVIGAVSYGDYFTLGGTGLATPIESMLAIRDNFAPRVQTMADPVITSGRVVDRVIVSAHPEKLGAAASSGALVARPLAAAFIGGLNPSSQAYKQLAAVLTRRGMTVAQIGSPLSAGASSFSTELVPGAAVGELASRGDMWIGGLGTVTYADGNDVLAFGHPAFGTGATSLYMTNVWITGVWPSSYWPYKLGYPSVIQGAITQDRGAGIMGQLGDPPVEAPVTAEVTNTDTSQQATSSVWFASKLFDDGSLWGAAGSAASVAGYKLFDQYPIPGSADTTVTVVVSNGTHDYTVTIPNMYDDSSDIPYYMTTDVNNAVDSLTGVVSEGLETPHIVSVDLQASLTSSRRAAEVARVDALAPLQWGDNRVRVSLLAYGIEPTQTIDATITIPEGTPLEGTLSASSVYGSYDNWYGGSSYTISSDGMVTFSPSTPTRTKLADVVKELNSTRPNNLLSVTFMPVADGSGDGGSAPSSSETTLAVETTTSSPWVLSGSATSEITVIDAYADPVTYGDDAHISGEISGPSAPVEVKVYGVPAGSDTEELLTTGQTEMVDGTLMFDIPVSGLFSSTELRVAVDGGLGYSPAETFVDVAVRGRVSLSASPKTVWRGSWVVFTVKVAPRSATGSIRFQWYDAHHKKWRALITKKLTHTSSTAKASCMWRPYRGTYKVRAIYSGDWNLAGKTSSTVTIRVR